MGKKRSILEVLSLMLVFVLLLEGVALAIPIQLPSGQTIDLTQEKLRKIVSYDQVECLQELPTPVPEGEAIIPMPNLPEGSPLNDVCNYIKGTPERLAAAMNFSGVTVGATPTSLGISVTTLGIIGAVVVLVGGVIAIVASTDSTSNH